MSKKKKLAKAERAQRRLWEAKRAEGRVEISATKNTFTASPVLDGNSNAMDKNKDLRFTLPIKEIKLDMFKNAAYMIFTILVLITIKVSGIDITSFVRVLSGNQ